MTGDQAGLVVATIATFALVVPIWLLGVRLATRQPGEPILMWRRAARSPLPRHIPRVDTFSPDKGSHVHVFPLGDTTHIHDAQECPCRPELLHFRRKDGSDGYAYLHHAQIGARR